jgi:hypothetical protein
MYETQILKALTERNDKIHAHWEEEILASKP